MSGRLTDGFRDIIDLRWDDFVAMEQSLDATNFDSVVTGIVRACKKGNLRAIQTALDRLDGKIAMEIEVEMPKFYTLYPYATKTADDPSIIDEAGEVSLDDLKLIEPVIEKNGGTIFRGTTPLGPNEFAELVGSPADVEEQEAAEEELPTGSLRAVLEKMMNSPKSIVTDLLAAADRVDAGDLSGGNPMVKSVIVAGLMKLVHDGRMSAVFEVFNQIDGKVADKLKVLGDTYVTRFDTIAPIGAVKNEKGIYQVESKQMTDAWGARLAQISKGKR
jgi:hypothetical protein